MNRFGQSFSSWSDLAPGMAVHLDPDRLEELGGRYSGPEVHRVRGPHTFLVLLLEGDLVVLCPLFSRPGPRRIAIPTSGREGHPAFVGATFYRHMGQTWTASRRAVADAAAAGGDLSRAGSRNRIALPSDPTDTWADPQTPRRAG